MPTEAERFFDYCVTIAQEFKSRLSRMRVFVKHNLSSGTANETILRDFLSNHVQGAFNVAEGFICNPFENDVVSRQCDVLIYHQNRFPLVYSDGPVKIVWPEAVAMVIEVKTSFPKGEIKRALENVAAAKRTNKDLTSVIFAFGSPTLETVIEHLESRDDHIEPEFLPTAILLLDRAAIIHRWEWGRGDYVDADAYTYAVLVGKEEPQAIVVAFLLLLFFQAVDPGWLEARFINTLNDLLKKYTDERPNIRIGAGHCPTT